MKLINFDGIKKVAENPKGGLFGLVYFWSRKNPKKVSILGFEPYSPLLHSHAVIQLVVSLSSRTGATSSQMPVRWS